MTLTLSAELPYVKLFATLIIEHSHKVMSTCLVRFGLNVLLRSILQVTLGDSQTPGLSLRWM